MRKILFNFVIVSFVLILMATFVFAETLTLQSKISEVMIYPGSALVTRTASVSLSPGEHSVVFEDIIPAIDENSLTVSGEGTAQVKIFGAQIKTEYLKEAPDERVKELEKKIEAVNDQIAGETSKLAILDQEREFLNSVKLFSGQQIPKDLVTNMPPATELENTLNFLSTKLQTNEDKKESGRLAIRDLNKQKEVLQNELNQLRGSMGKMKRSIMVDVECSKAGSLDLSFSYLVGGVYWQPFYDARVSMEKSEVELASYGAIKQNTGEDWTDVNLALSTAKPNIGGRMPYVSPWVLEVYQPYRQEGKAAGKSMFAMKAAVQSEAFRSDQIVETGEPASAPAEVAYSQAAEKGISVVYKLPKKVTVKSDGTDHKVPISSQMLKVDFEYSTFPRASSYAYLGSRVTNAKDEQLLAGRVNIFLDGDFMGTSTIDNIGPNEEFDLYLGVDENVKVKREEIEKKSDDILIGNISSPNRTITFKHKLTIENYKNKPIKVNLFEALPVSQNERIKVKLGEPSLKPNDKDWKDRKGIWRWELKLEPQAKQEIFYGFSVEHPRDMQVMGL